ncbi:Ig-like domain-containing protein [Alloalcanivorax xenomutans]|uniref:Ig-like domain-containing protein n=1 Tax=Alloalcanivorax xenomutans TaxID=1094342 RepID=UPI003BA90AF4
MITLTLKRGALLISSALILSACGGGGGSDMPGPDAGESKRQSLLYAYPDNGQTEVPTPAPVVLRFSSAVTVDAAEAAITLHEGDASGPALAATFSTVDGEPRGLVLTPDDKLKPLTDYTVVIKNLKLEKGTAANQVLGFTTRPLHEGPRSLVVSSDDFVIERRIPDGGSSEPVMDFSTFRFQFSQPIDPATVHYGNAPASSTAPADNVGLYDSQGNLVDAVLVVNDRYMTVDPNPQSDDPEDKYFSYLTPGETYTLRLGDGITSVYGETFGGDEIAFTPKDSSPRGEPAVLVQRITDSADRTNLSPLTGKPINEVPVNGVLLGEDANITQASNNAVMAELADVTQYPDVTPIRLPRNTVLDGSSIDVLIGGHVPAGFSSGQVEMRMLSDATGYLVPNPYNSNRSDALRIVHLFMDVAIATEDPRTNGAFTQDILHIELIGTAAVDTTEGVLNIDAVSVVEPNVLGQEYGYGLLSFQLQSYKDQQNPPVDAMAEMEDKKAPMLQSWMPGNKVDLQRPGDPIVLNFNKPIDAKTLKGNLWFYENGIEKAIDYRVDGAAVIVKPEEDIQYSRETQAYEYELVLGAGIKDTSGQSLPPITLEPFSLPTVVEKRTLNGTEQDAVKRSALVVATYPGFPCPRVDMDLANDDGGRCVDSLPGVFQEDWPDLNLTEYDLVPEDDHLPIPDMPANQPIIAQFSKPMDKESIQLGGSFKVEKVDASGNPLEAVDGDLKVSKTGLKFFPEAPWEEGQLYRYTLGSNGDPHSSVANCDGTSAICDWEGLPLQTVWFADLTIKEMNEPFGGDVPNAQKHINTFTERKPATSGGPEMSLYFKGAAPSNGTLMVLNTEPASDVNGNLVHDRHVPDMVNGDLGFFIIATDEDAEDYQYGVEEVGLTESNGSQPPNSARVISLDTKGVPSNADEIKGVNGLMVGCGPELRANWEAPATGFYGIPYECPENQHTYLSGSLVTEVTNEFVEGKGIKVKIWPATILSTSLITYPRVGFLPAYLRTSTGPQYMRMRYTRDDGGTPSEPVIGYIEQGDNGAILNVSVDLYLDAPEVRERQEALSVITNLISLPIDMNLSGPIHFLDDGRMQVDQINTEDMSIPFIAYGSVKSETGLSSLPLIVPKGESWLRYVSEPIK